MRVKSIPSTKSRTRNTNQTQVPVLTCTVVINTRDTLDGRTVELEVSSEAQPGMLMVEVSGGEDELQKRLS